MVPQGNVATCLRCDGVFHTPLLTRLNLPEWISLQTYQPIFGKVMGSE